MDDQAREIADMFETVSLGAPQKAVGFVMWRVMHRYVREVDQTLKSLNFTHLQFTVLTLVAWLSRGGDRATQAELARFGDIHPMQISNIVSTLERKMMVGRSPSPGNAPAKHVMLTPYGIDALRSALPLVIEVQRKLFGQEGLPGGSLLEALNRIDAAR